MKIKLVLLLVLSMVINSCGKPSYKKNKILKTQEEAASESSIFDEIPLNQELTAAQQIASATLVVPKAARDGATVYGYSENGEFMTLREGTNDFICIANNPKKDGFQIVAYHKSLEPMMARGRELDSDGKSREEKEEIRAKEAETGKMPLPEAPATLHIYYGPDAYFNTETDKIENGKFRYVVYIPYATQESTGLSLAPNEPGHPWLMFPGQYNAHIMITPEY